MNRSVPEAETCKNAKLVIPVNIGICEPIPPKSLILSMVSSIVDDPDKKKEHGGDRSMIEHPGERRRLSPLR